MVNGLGVLGWGVGGIEAEAAMLGQPVSMLIPEVVGFHLTARSRRGSPPPISSSPSPRCCAPRAWSAASSNFSAPGLGAVGRRPRDHRQHGARIWRDLRLLPDRPAHARLYALTGRDATIALAEAYAKAQGMWLDAAAPDPVFTETLRARHVHVEPSLAGPKRPQDKVLLSQVDDEFNHELEHTYKQAQRRRACPVDGDEHRLRPWRRRDRRDHLLHQHLQPVGAGRRRPGRAQGAGARA